MIDVVAERGFLSSTLQIIQLLQMILQARWIDEPAILNLPYVEKKHLPLFSNLSICLPLFCSTVANNYSQLSKILSEEMVDNHISKVSINTFHEKFNDFIIYYFIIFVYSLFYIN
jgi:activating signal cointegrator complex subunit 3